MNEWYYAEGNRQRQGPLPAENLLSLYRSGRIALDTLVWREGMAQWQPLADFAAELGLEAAAAPPGTDPETPAPPPLPPAPAVAPAPHAVPPARQGLSGCAIAGIVAGVIGVFLLTVLGILAAIALPAYQDYVLRSKTSAALAEISPLESRVAEFHATEGRCPANGDKGFDTPESYAGSSLAELRIGRFDNGHCGMEAILAVPDHKELAGKALWLDYDEQGGEWRCSSEIDDRYLPAHCRG